MVYNVLSNDFENFLNDIFIGTQINRLYFDDNNKDNDADVILSKNKIFPIICKKYNILFPHDYNSIDIAEITKFKMG